MEEKDVIELMESSQTEQEWNKNCDKVKEVCNGYPDFWNAAIVVSGLAGRKQMYFEYGIKI